MLRISINNIDVTIIAISNKLIAKLVSGNRNTATETITNRSKSRNGGNCGNQVTKAKAEVTTTIVALL